MFCFSGEQEIVPAVQSDHVADAPQEDLRVMVSAKSRRERYVEKKNDEPVNLEEWGDDDEQKKNRRVSLLGFLPSIFFCVPSIPRPLALLLQRPTSSSSFLRFLLFVFFVFCSRVRPPLSGCSQRCLCVRCAVWMSRRASSSSVCRVNRVTGLGPPPPPPALVVRLSPTRWILLVSARRPLSLAVRLLHTHTHSFFLSFTLSFFLFLSAILQLLPQSLHGITCVFLSLSLSFVHQLVSYFPNSDDVQPLASVNVFFSFIIGRGL